MQKSLMALIVTLSLSSGCVTAVRKVEQSLGRERDKSEKSDRPLGRNRSADAADVRFAVKPDHPRLFATGDWPKPVDEVADQWRTLLTRRANETIDAAPIDYSPKKMLARSREALKRISVLAGVYRFTGDKRYADAGARELLNVCSFDDWQPNDFLATAEMMNAVSIGYDWLYDTLAPADRRKIVAAIVQNGLEPALGQYHSQGGWTAARHNWNLVCNGGVIVAALAVANEEPATSRRALGQALSSIDEGLAAFDAAGGTAEGPMYHSYAMRYLTFAAAALDTAMADNADNPLIKDRRGNYRAWTNAGDYRLAMTGPTGKSANFGDGSETLGNTAWMLWLAKTFNDKRYADFETDVDRAEPSIFDLLWHVAPEGRALARKEVARRAWQGPQAAFGSAIVLRDSLTDPKSTFVTVRTGSTADHHSHLDLGTFVLDMLGERFAMDLGADNYDLPGYLTNRRADYLRSSTPGHNTLSIGNASQPADAESTASLSTDGRSATVDMTAAYPGAKSVIRAIDLDQNRVTITDNLRVKRDSTFVWNLHTPARVKLTRDGAILDANGKQVALNIVAPRGAKFTAEPDETTPPELPIQGVTHVRLKVPVDDAEKIVIEFVPANIER